MGSANADQAAAFQAVVETGSFALAGRRLGRDASVVSRRVTALETRLGIRLLERSTRRVTPTEAGLRYFARLQTVAELLRTAEEEARAMAALPSGLLRLAVPATFGRMWVAGMLPDFLARYPALRLQVDYSDRYTDLVAEGYDAAIRLGALKDSRLIVRRLASSWRLLCAAPTYLDRCGHPRTPEDLTAHDCLCFTRLATHPTWHLERDGQSRAVRLVGRMETDDADAVLKAALGGAGIVMAANWQVSRELADGRLLRVLPDWNVGREEGVSVVRPSTRHAAAKSRVFVEWLAERFAVPPWQAEASTPDPHSSR
ncbi:LysR family transcriptional regulator [Azospirillum griseum]|uniref:LysR family transcriptional regulator n=1 Tax=Azospirillum griseum TaxID=2496639 RepID=A0A431VPC0_9PROT|nr:LysR family transcriptional regulator [Azospirillum griseum]RTR24632.1 LysR family transcriptional regulator [Azospirillum griseum]